MNDNKRMVFIVDDDDPLRESLSFLMKSIGIEARGFSSAPEFLEFYNDGIVGCLVLDIRMPGMSGLELQDRLNEMNAILPIIFITGHGDVPMAVEAMKKGALDFIQKPFRDQDLIDRINHRRGDAIHSPREQVLHLAFLRHPAIGHEHLDLDVQIRSGFFGPEGVKIPKGGDPGGDHRKLLTLRFFLAATGQH